MNWDALISLVVVLVIVLSQVLGVLAKRFKSHAPRPETGPKPKNQDGPGGWARFTNRLKAELEQAQHPGPVSDPAQNGWAQILPEADRTRTKAEPAPAEFEPAPEPAPKTDGLMASDPASSRADPEPPPPDASFWSPDAAEHPASTLADSPSAWSLAGEFQSVSRQDLRRAIVWSEILGPPVAWRNHF